jgi:hypothetical protein
MAQIFSASIYGLNGQSIGTAQGVTMGFATQSVIIRPAPPGAGSLFNTVQTLSIIEMLPAGTRVINNQWFAIAPVATLVTAANA